MRLWVGLAYLVAFLPVGLSFALTTGEQPDELAAVRATYRRPEVIPFPSSNPYSDAKAALGEMLFFDPLLSRSKTRSCATCHNPSLSWGDGLAHAIGEDPKGLPLRAPSLIDVAFIEPLGWDGKFADIESVAFGPITNPMNMNLTEADLIARLSAIPAYGEAFTRAFGDDAITRPRIEAALATFQRTKLKAHGLRIALGDFGTGYSSLSYLRGFPFDKLKIDQSFVRDATAMTGSKLIVRSIIGLGKSLGMTTTAEGVETMEQLNQMRAEGCDEAQGYLISRPVPATQVASTILALSKGVKKDRWRNVIAS
ncbi:EAL domain-containing protein [Bradyrhizobium yuanmingense]|uniref:cytochrome-c peroxidase n=1 Tax=Bradyrhizobium yuanmingense TaxID=108015 RepID=UPI0012FC5BDA|nr:EAL domain-containing protein [Bradyrhizobium yuanmingense]